MNAPSTNFAVQRKYDDMLLVNSHSIRTRADVVRAADGYPGDHADPFSPAFVMRDKLFCAAARHYGADVCGGCGNLTLHTEIVSYNNAPSLCSECDEQSIYATVCALPQWVKDRDLPEIIPALVRAYCRTQAETGFQIRPSALRSVESQ